jgi:hypothetical protein
MPPWFLERNIGIQKMKDDVSLSDEEIATIAKWVDSGAPEGDPKDLPPPVTFADAGTWTLGKPDLIVSSPSFTVAAVASDIGTSVGHTPTGLTEDRYAKSVEFKEVARYVGKKPAGSGTIGSLFAIHHANVGIGNPGDSTDGSVEEDGAANGNGGSSAEFISAAPYEVGRNGDVFPPEAGKLVPARSVLMFDNVHIHSSGVPGSERVTRLDVGLRLHPKGYQPKYRVRGASFGRSELQAKPGLSNQRIDAYFIVEQPMKLATYEPHMHSTGVRMCLEAIWGRVTETLNCAGYDHNWVRTYTYEDNYAPLLPKGTILHAIGWYDNTAKNQNVLDPRNLSTYGNSSVNNMFIVFNQAVFLTDEQYQEEITKRRQYVERTQEEPLGCPGCYAPPPRATAAAKR